MWTVPFRQYLEFDGVKEGIQEVKYKKKMEANEGFNKFGMQVESFAVRILSEVKDFEVKALSPQMDIGFGADVQVAYQEGGKNFSFFLDVTATQKPLIRYFSLTGTTTDNPKEAFKYQTEYGNIYFGIKEKHANWFFYEKPVVVMYIENFVPATGLALSHIANISEILRSLNKLLLDMGYGARASQLIRPNIKRFAYEYTRELDTPEVWGEFIARCIKL